MSEPFLRMPKGKGYATHDGRFYVEPLKKGGKRVGWHVIDALPRLAMQTGVLTLADARVWIQRRRRASA